MKCRCLPKSLFAKVESSLFMACNEYFHFCFNFNMLICGICGGSHTIKWTLGTWVKPRMQYSRRILCSAVFNGLQFKD